MSEDGSAKLGGVFCITLLPFFAQFPDINPLFALFSMNNLALAGLECLPARNMSAIHTCNAQEASPLSTNLSWRVQVECRVQVVWEMGWGWCKWRGGWCTLTRGRNMANCTVQTLGLGEEWNGLASGERPREMPKKKRTLTGGRNIANCTKGGMEGGSPDLLSSLASLKQGQDQMDMRINVPPQHNISYIT